MRTSPGSSIAIASSAVTTAAVRSTEFDARASIRSLIERSMELSGQNPSAQLFRSAVRSVEMDCLNRMAEPLASSLESQIGDAQS